MSGDPVDRLVVEEVGAGRVRVALRRAGQDYDEVSGEVAFTAPLSEADRQDLRWYLEDYLSAPYAVYEQRGQAVRGRLQGWGEALFEAVFGTGTPGRDAYQRARERPAELALVSRSPAFLGLPWSCCRTRSGRHRWRWTSSRSTARCRWPGRRWQWRRARSCGC